MATRKAKRMIVLAALCAVGGSAETRGALIGQWIADNYTAGSATWADSTAGAHTATAVGTLTTTANAFGAHKAINFAGGDGAAATGYFTVVNNATTLVGATGLTLVAVIKPTAAGTSVGGQFWQKSGLIGNEQPGAVNDWGLGFAASQADMGVGNPDTTVVSAAQNLNQPYVEIGTWDTSGNMAVYINGVQVASTSTAPTAARDNNASGAFGLGASEATANSDLHIFTGQVAELRVYNDNSQNIAALTSSLAATYAIPEPTSLALAGAGGLILLGRRRGKRDRKAAAD